MADEIKTILKCASFQMYWTTVSKRTIKFILIPLLNVWLTYKSDGNNKNYSIWNVKNIKT